MNHKNLTSITGNLVYDPEVRKTADGKTLATMFIACDTTWKDSNGEQRKDTDFYPVVVWNAIAEYAERELKKGDLVWIEGRFKKRSWVDPTGAKKEKWELHATERLSKLMTK